MSLYLQDIGIHTDTSRMDGICGVIYVCVCEFVTLYASERARARKAPRPVQSYTARENPSRDSSFTKAARIYRRVTLKVHQQLTGPGQQDIRLTIKDKSSREKKKK